MAERLRNATDPQAEAKTLVAELKALGHVLYSWDEGEDWEDWGDDYSRPQRNRIVIELAYPPNEYPSASVTFGPWPQAKSPAG